MIPLKTGRVRASFMQGGRVVRQDALMIGYPGGGSSPVAEILTTTGRSTLVETCNITPIDDDARLLLRGSTSKRFSRFDR